MTTATRAAAATMIHRVLDLMTQAPSIAMSVGRSEPEQRDCSPPVLESSCARLGVPTQLLASRRHAVANMPSAAAPTLERAGEGTGSG